MSQRYFYGWNVVAATFVMGLFSFGLGFYGVTVYVATLERIHGWSVSAVSVPVTVYYIAGALLTMVIGTAFERFGPRVVVSACSVAMAAGVAALGCIGQPWRLYELARISWTGSLRGLPLPFERQRTEIAERRVPPVGIVEEFDVVEHRAVRVRPRSPGPVVIELGEQRICTDADGFAAVAAAPGAASVRVWEIMSRTAATRGVTARGGR
jgi:hypothetical protein